MYNLNFVTPKGTRLRETASYEPSCIKISSVVFPVQDGKKKEKGRKGKAHKVTQTLYFSYSWGIPPWTDFHQILHVKRYAGLSHLWKFWCEKIKGFGIYGGSNFWCSTEMAGHPYKCCATAQPLIPPWFKCFFCLRNKNISRWRHRCVKMGCK